MNIRNLNIQDTSSDALQALYERIGQELQDREYRIKENLCNDIHIQEEQIMEGYTNEEVFEDALAMGLTPDDPEVIAGEYAKEFAEYIAQKERKQSMRTTGA
jgi:hypothetical protein